MAIQKYEVSAVSLEELLESNSLTVKGSTQWVIEHAEPLLKRHGLTFDRLTSTSYPLTICYSKNGTQAEAARIVSELAGVTGRFDAGIENAYSPFVRVTDKFRANTSRLYCVATFWKQGKIAIKFIG